MRLGVVSADQSSSTLHGDMAALSPPFLLPVLLLLGVDAVSRGAASSAASSVSPDHGRPGAAAGAVAVDENLVSMKTVWGHDLSAKGADSIGEDALARVDILRGLRDHTTSEDCRRALDQVVLARTSLRLGALKMHSSSAVLPDALLSGSMSHMGDFDACLSVPGAMYCLADTELRPLSAVAADRVHQGDEQSPFDVPNGNNASLWDLMQISGNRRRYRRDNQQWAVCVPLECGQVDTVRDKTRASRGGVRDLAAALARTVDGVARSLDVQLRIGIDPTFCDVNQTPSLLQSLLEQWLFLVGSALILLFPVLTILATTADVVAGKDSDKAPAGALPSALRCFNAVRNWKDLSRRQASQIHAIQGIRVLCTFMVIGGHRVVFGYGGPVLDPETYENFFTDPLKVMLANGHCIIGTFFVIMAFLEARLCLKVYERMGRFCWKVMLMQYVHRLIRLVPPMAVVIAFSALWLEHLGSGPLWNQLVADGMGAACRQNWWASLLFINNYYHPDGLCLVQTWFLSASMQMYVLTPAVMWFVYRATRRSSVPGVFILVLLLGAAAIVLYACTVGLGLMPTTPLYPMFLRRWNFVTYPTFLQQYLPTHTNFMPYVAGLIAGTLSHAATTRRWAPSKRARRWLLLGIPLTMSLQLATLSAGGIFTFVHATGQRPWLESLYGPARLVISGLAAAWLVFTCSTGCGGAFGRALSWMPFLFLGRLTYSVMLVHLGVIMVSLGRTRQPMFLGTADYVNSVAADCVWSYAFGAVLYLCVEAPVAKMQQIMVDKGLRRWEDKEEKLRADADLGDSRTPATPATGP